MRERRLSKWRHHPVSRWSWEARKKNLQLSSPRRSLVRCNGYSNEWTHFFACVSWVQENGMFPRAWVLPLKMFIKAEQWGTRQISRTNRSINSEPLVPRRPRNEKGAGRRIVKCNKGTRYRLWWCLCAVVVYCRNLRGHCGTQLLCAHQSSNECYLLRLHRYIVEKFILVRFFV